MEYSHLAKWPLGASIWRCWRRALAAPAPPLPIVPGLADDGSWRRSGGSSSEAAPATDLAPDQLTMVPGGCPSCTPPGNRGPARQLDREEQLNKEVAGGGTLSASARGVWR
jgi:hypothetical protein